MVITEEQFRRIEHCLPTQRGNVKISNLDVLNAILYVTENGCKWRSLPKRFGRWDTVYARLRRWAEAGVLDRVFTALQEVEIIGIRGEALSLDSTMGQVHPDGTGAEENGPQAIGRSRGGWSTKIHMVAADDPRAVTFSLTPGQWADAPAGRELLRTLPPLRSRWPSSWIEPTRATNPDSSPSISASSRSSPQEDAAPSLVIQ